MTLLEYKAPNDEFFNEEQKNCYKELVKFINLTKDENINARYFLLNGPAGSGKTYVLCNLISQIKSFIKFKILAPTHKACCVIRKDIYGYEVETVAKFLGYKEEIDDNGTKKISYNLDSKKLKEKLLIIDECSMISTEQLNVLLKINVSIIFVGDIYQINPVGEEETPVFKLDFFCSAQLIKNERIKDEILGSTIINFRESVQKNYLQKKCIENNYRAENRTHFELLLVESFKNYEDAVYLSYTNSSVLKYNEYIRKHLFGPDVSDYVQNEVLICDTYFYSEHSKFYTSQKVIVENCRKTILNIFNPSCICSKKSFIFYSENSEEKEEKINKCQKCHTPTSLINFKKIEFWAITLKNINSSYFKETFYKPVNGMTELYPIIYKYRDRAKLSKSKSLWSNYYLMINKLNAPMSYSYAMTVHKAQGSGYNKVFIDMENIMFCQKESEKLRLLYTAISRAREYVLFVK